MDGETALRWIFTVITSLVILAAIGRMLEYALLNIPGIMRRSRSTQAAKQRPQADAAPAAPRKAAGAVAVPDYGAFVEAQQDPRIDWLTEVNDKPNINPHVAACGPSGSGKSTLVLGALAKRKGRIVITTPKPYSQDPWADFPVVRLRITDQGADWTPIEQAIRAVYLEMWRRNGADEQGEEITLVIDEFATTKAKLPALTEAINDIWTMGRSAGIRLITMSPEVNVKAWGIEGRGDIRENILFVECDYSEATGQRTARMYRWGKPARSISVAGIPTLAAAGLDPARLWVPTLTPPAKSAQAQRERPPVTAEELAEAMRAHRAEHGSMPSKRAMEMRLYGHYAGAAHEKVSAVWDEAVALVQEG